MQRVGVDGPQLGSGLLNPGGGQQRVMVLASRAEEARAVLAETLVEDSEALPEPVNAAYLADARGHRPRGYGLLGAYARIYLVSLAAIAAALAIFLLVRVL